MIARLVRRARGDESGIAMIIAVVLSTVTLTLVVMSIGVAANGDKAATRGRSWVQALHVAESGAEQAIGKIQVAGAYTGSFTGSIDEGTYSVTVTRDIRNNYTITSTGSVRQGRQLGATRKIQVTMSPPVSFKYAFFSNTSVTTKNGDVINGDIWANQNLVITQGSTVNGSVTAATGYVSQENGTLIGGNIISGGFNPATNYSIDVQTNARVTGSVQATVVNPPDPITCGGANQSNYKVHVDSGAVVSGSGKTWGTFTGSGTIQGGITNNVCISAPATQPLPTFTYSSSNYDASTLHEFGQPGTPSATALSDFQNWVNAQPGMQINGTFYINQSGPIGQSTRVDLTGVTLTNDTTIVTNTPVFANGVADNSTNKIFALISTYDPPTGTSCVPNQDNSECSINLKNNFDSSCVTAIMAFAPYGPISVKNNATECGAVYADDIEVMNNQTFTYDPRVDRIAGFGSTTLEQHRWVELKP